MNKFTLIFLGAILLVGCTSTPPNQINNNGSAVVTSYPQNADAGLQICEKTSSEEIQGINLRDECFYDLAMKRLNATLCLKINASKYYFEPYTIMDCVSAVAASSNDSSLCVAFNLPGGPEVCYYRLALETGNISYCELSDYFFDQQKFYRKFDCYADVAKSTHNWSICEYSSYYDPDNSTCYYNAATTTNNLSYCDHITDNPQRCSLSNSSSCFPEINDPSKVNCYASVSLHTQNPGICSTLSASADQDVCFYSYAMYSFNLTYCGDIIDQNARHSCEALNNSLGFQLGRWY